MIMSLTVNIPIKLPMIKIIVLTDMSVTSMFLLLQAHLMLISLKSILFIMNSLISLSL